MDSISFLPAALGAKSQSHGRNSLVNHSGSGEFAYRENNWKLVFKFRASKSSAENVKPVDVELYDLVGDIAEKHDLASQHPELVQRLAAKLQATIDNGRSRPGSAQANDRKVRIDQIPIERWAPALN